MIQSVQEREAVLQSLGKAKSLWVETTPSTAYGPVADRVTVDAAVIGGGITGITAAVLLKQAGRSVVLIEGGRIARNVSGHTTAKITSAHGIIYRYLKEHFGTDKAFQYAHANQSSIDFIEQRVSQRHIDCDFRRVPSYVYTEDLRQRDEFKAEADAAASLGLPAFYTEDVPVPFAARGAVVFRDQARFHPRKYLLALADEIPGDGSYIFEHSRAFAVKDGDTCEVKTDRGTIRAKSVIIATHFPFVMGGEFFAKIFPRQSYLLGMRVSEEVFDGMFYDPSNSHTLRIQPSDDGPWVLFGGDHHKTGHGGDITARYRRLEEYVKNHYTVENISFRWTTQDNMTMDSVPYIGKLTSGAKNVYVATGFGGWGMSNGTVAGMILSDLILGKENPWSPVFDSTRLKPAASAKTFISQNMQVAGDLIGGKLKPSDDLAKLALDEAAIVTHGGEKVAVYKDQLGSLHPVSATCTHMGCTIVWDDAQRTWDCPCHGSRFTYHGGILYGPATKKLEQKKLT